MEVKETKQVAGGRFLRLFERTYSHEGHDGRWMFASRDVTPPTHEQKKPDAVIIVAVKIDEDEPKIVLTSEYRIPLLAREISFPAGLIDDADYEDSNLFAGIAHELREGNALIKAAATRAAIRECWEETNLAFTPLIVSPPNLYTSAGMTNEAAIFVMGTVTGDPSSKNSGKSEDIEVHILNLNSIQLFLEGKNKLFSGHAMSGKAWMILQPFVEYGFPSWVTR